MFYEKVFSLCAGLLVAANLCAVVLPDGKNVRADDVTTYESGAIKSVTLRERTEITTPIGPITASGVVYYYENGTVKSINTGNNDQATDGGELPGCAIHTNLGTITRLPTSGKYGGAPSTSFTFYESGSLWFIGAGGIASTAIHTPNGDFMLTGHILFYDSGSTDNLIIHKANIAIGSQKPPTITTKSATFSLKDTYSGDGGYAPYNRVPHTVEEMRYGIDGFEISFYKNGNIEKIYIDENTAKDMTVQTSLGELFVRGNDLPLMFWEDGSIKQCVNDDVLQANIYGRNVQIPVGGLLRFRRDGSVWAYTTSSNVSYTVGGVTYTTNDNSNTLVFDETGNVAQLLGKSSNRLTPALLKFYDSGSMKKFRSPQIRVSGQTTNLNALADNGSFWALEDRNGLAYMYQNKLRSVPNAMNSQQYEAKIVCMDFLVDIVYFADNGYPASYDVIKTAVDNADIQQGGFRISNMFGSTYTHLFVEMTEDSEFVILPDRVRGLQFTPIR